MENEETTTGAAEAAAPVVTEEEKLNQKRKKAIKVALVTMSITLTICLTVIFSVNHYLNQINFDSGAEEEVLLDEPAPQEQPMTDPTPQPTPVPLSEEELLIEQLEGETELIGDDSDVMNILLLGVDNRAAGKTSRGRTDTMIMISINRDRGKIVMTSFMRDMYVKITGNYSERINVAHALAGPALLEQVLENSFGLSTDRYVTVDFYCFMDIVDIFGGIELELSREEISDMQRIIQEMNELTGDPWGTDFLPSSAAGTYHLNGKQALAYARSRYSGGGDSGRTQRQRNVLTQLFEKAKELDLVQLKDLMEAVLPNITTDMTKGEIISLLLKYKTYLGYELVSNRVPAEGTSFGTMINNASVISVDFAKNREILAEIIYGD